MMKERKKKVCLHGTKIMVKERKKEIELCKLMLVAFVHTHRLINLGEHGLVRLDVGLDLLLLLEERLDTANVLLLKREGDGGEIGNVSWLKSKKDTRVLLKRGRKWRRDWEWRGG